MEPLGKPRMMKKELKKIEKNEKEAAFLKRKPPIAPLSPEKVDHRVNQNELSWSESKIREKSQSQIDPFFRHVSTNSFTGNYHSIIIYTINVLGRKQHTSIQYYCYNIWFSSTCAYGYN